MKNRIYPLSLFACFLIWAGIIGQYTGIGGSLEQVSSNNHYTVLQPTILNKNKPMEDGGVEVKAPKLYAIVNQDEK